MLVIYPALGLDDYCNYNLSHHPDIKESSNPCFLGGDCSTIGAGLLSRSTSAKALARRPGSDSILSLAVFFPKYILFIVIVPGGFSQNIFTIFGFDILHLRTTISTATPIWTAWYILLGILCEKKKKKHCVMRKSASRGFEISEQMKFKHSVIGKKKWSSFCLNMRYSLKNDVWPNKSWNWNYFTLEICQNLVPIVQWNKWSFYFLHCENPLGSPGQGKKACKFTDQKIGQKCVNCY